MNVAASPARSSKRQFSILIADDSTDAVLTLSALLHDAGHAVHAINTGSMVLEAVRRYRPHVCILDIQMPELNGFQLADAIYREFRDAAPLLIAISGKWTSDVDKHVARTVGFRHFLQKPAHPHELFAILDGYTPLR